jgi:hypothetical protein
MSRPKDDGNIAERFQDDGLGSHATFCGHDTAKKTSPMCWHTPGLLFGRFRLNGEPDNRTAALHQAIEVIAKMFITWGSVKHILPVDSRGLALVQSSPILNKSL